MRHVNTREKPITLTLYMGQVNIREKLITLTVYMGHVKPERSQLR